MSMSKPHIVLLPSSGMGHLTPFLRIASTLLSRSCHVTLITAVPTVSAAEASHISSFLSDHPEVNHAQLRTAPKPNSNSDQQQQDPFFLQFEATGRAAAAQLRPLLMTSSPISAVFADLAVTSSTAPISAELGIPCYAVVPSSVRFVCVAARLPFGLGFKPDSDVVEIPGLGPVLSSSLPQQLKDPSHIFTTVLTDNVKALLEGSVEGIILNSYESFESEAIKAINGGKVSDSLPKVIPIGPLNPCPSPSPPTPEKKGSYKAWLDDQPAGSVVYVSFGSRTAMSRDQIRELSKGLKSSGERFLWVLKTSKVDKEEEEEIMIGDLLGDSFSERGLVVREWVTQHEILSHVAVGAFVSHCGWNSVMEAMRSGVPVVSWPLHGDQRLNAEVVEKSGFGVWPMGWGSERLIAGEEIGERVSEVMGNQKLRETARRICREAMNAIAPGGTSDKAITEVLEFLAAQK